MLFIILSTIDSGISPMQRVREAGGSSSLKNGVMTKYSQEGTWVGSSSSSGGLVAYWESFKWVNKYIKDKGSQVSHFGEKYNYWKMVLD